MQQVSAAAALRASLCALACTAVVSGTSMSSHVLASTGAISQWPRDSWWTPSLVVAGRSLWCVILCGCAEAFIATSVGYLVRTVRSTLGCSPGAVEQICDLSSTMVAPALLWIPKLQRQRDHSGSRAWLELGLSIMVAGLYACIAHFLLRSAVSHGTGTDSARSDFMPLTVLFRVCVTAAILSDRTSVFGQGVPEEDLSSSCVCCLDQSADVVFLKCGHRTYCFECHEKVLDTKNLCEHTLQHGQVPESLCLPEERCPFCRQASIVVPLVVFQQRVFPC